MKNTSSLYLCGVIVAVLLWSTSFVGTKIAYASFSPLTLGAVRFVIAAFVLGLIMLFTKKEPTKHSLKDTGLMCLSGLLGITIYFALENIGLELTTSSNAALIIASYPAITALVEFLIYRTRISWIKGLGIMLAIIGVYQISNSQQSQEGEHQFIGHIILILAGFVFAFYTLTTRKVVEKYPMITVSFYQTLVGAVAFIPLAFIEKSSWHVPTMESFLMVLYLGVFCSVVAFFLYNYGLRKLSSSSAVSLMNLVPVFGVLFSVLFLNEVVGASQFIGGGIVIFGVFLSISDTNIRLAQKGS